MTTTQYTSERLLQVLLAPQISEKSTMSPTSTTR
jgi:hypothetical protein